MTYGCNGAESIYNNADIFLYMYSQITTFNETTLHNFLMLTDCQFWKQSTCRQICKVFKNLDTFQLMLYRKAIAI